MSHRCGCKAEIALTVERGKLEKADAENDILQSRYEYAQKLAGDRWQQIEELTAQVDALRVGMDEALFALYEDQPDTARRLRAIYLPPATGEKS